MATLRIHGYVTWEHFLGRISLGLSAIQQGVWLGILDNHHLDGLSRLQYERWVKYSSESHNLSGLQPWEESALAEHFPPGISILLGAAGGGRESVALAQHGYRVDSFDCVPVLVDRCTLLMSRLELTGQVFLADPSSIPDNLGKYDGAIIGWGGYMHIPGRANRIAFLKAIRERVPVGAPLLLSFFVRGEHSRRHDWIHGIAKWMRRLRFSHDPIEYGDSLAGTFDHYFTEAEVRHELSEGGFQLATYNESPYGHALGRAI